MEGHARGADRMAGAWARKLKIPNKKYRITQEDWTEYGKEAGQIRNHVMLEEGKPNVVIAFEGGRGTKHMMDISRKAGIVVIDIKGIENG